MTAWAVVGGVLVLAGFMLGVAVAGGREWPLDLEILRAVQRPDWPGFERVAWVASRAGDTGPTIVLMLIVAGALAVFGGRVDLALFVLGAVALRGVGTPLKSLYASPRPPVDSVMIVEHASGFGYPSGHAFAAALLYGAIVVTAPRVIWRPVYARTIQVAAIVMMVLIAFSRIRLGAHWPSDVVGGLMFGLGFLCLWQASWTIHRLRRASG